MLARVHGNEMEAADFDLFGAQREPAPLSGEDGASALGAIAGGVGVRVLGKKRRKEKRDGE